MRIKHALRWMPLMAALAFASSAMAQPRRSRPARFDPATVTSVEGEIQDIQRISRPRAQEGVHLTLSTGTESIDVHLGPASYLDVQSVKLAKGDRVKVTGSKETVGGKTGIIAQEVQRGDEQLVLRDAAGVPAWSRGRR